MNTSDVRDRARVSTYRCRSAFIGGVTVLSAFTAIRIASAASVTEIHYVMGTYFAITVEGLAEPQARAAMRQCFGEARRLESVFSRYDADSELSRLNARSGEARAVLSADMAGLLTRALALHDATGGAFDVTIGRLTHLWRESPDRPTPEAVRAVAGDRSERRRLRGQRMQRVRPGVQLDFDGIAKGYAVDRCVALLRAAGVTTALVNLGESSQYALGAPADRAGHDGWEITIRDTAPETSAGTVRVRDQALSVSAVFGHSRTLAGERVGHIIDPATGEPLRTNALALVVSDNATDAEAYSKAVLIWGEKDTAFRAGPETDLGLCSMKEPVQASPVGAGLRAGAAGTEVRRHHCQSTLLMGSLATRLEKSHIVAVLYVEDGTVTSWHADRIGFRAARSARPIRPMEEPLL